MMEEDYIELKCYIKYNLYYGQKAMEIARALLEAGWPKELIEKAFKEVQKLTSYVPMPRQSPVGKFVKAEGRQPQISQEMAVPRPSQ